VIKELYPVILMAVDRKKAKSLKVEIFLLLGGYWVIFEIHCWKNQNPAQLWVWFSSYNTMVYLVGGSCFEFRNAKLNNSVRVSFLLKNMFLYPPNMGLYTINRTQAS